MHLMKSSEMETYKKKLLDLRAELLALEDSSKDAAQPVELDQSGMGSLSRMDALQAQLMAQEGARRRKRQLQKIDGALRRIEAGEYGRCFVCEEEIGASRLSMDPAITRCVSCVDE
jgi:DnaK suppressor protein